MSTSETSGPAGKEGVSEAPNAAVASGKSGLGGQVCLRALISRLNAKWRCTQYKEAVGMEHLGMAQRTRRPICKRIVTVGTANGPTEVSRPTFPGGRPTSVQGEEDEAAGGRRSGGVCAVCMARTSNSGRRTRPRGNSRMRCRHAHATQTQAMGLVAVRTRGGGLAVDWTVL